MLVWIAGIRVACCVALAFVLLAPRPVAAVPASSTVPPAIQPWETMAVTEHLDRAQLLIKIIEGSFVGNATIYQTLVSHNDLPGIDRDVPLLRLVFSEKVFFDTDRTAIRPEAVRVLQLVADALRLDAPDVALFVAGHADARGDDAYNYDLSLRRASAVAGELFELGIGDKRLWQIGFGEAVPLAPNTSAENMARNRRVEFLYGARAEVVAVWLSKQAETVCEGYSEATRATCLEKIALLPVTVALPVFSESTAAVDPMRSGQAVIEQAATSATVRLDPTPTGSTEVHNERHVVPITRQTPIIIHLTEKRITLGEPQF